MRDPKRSSRSRYCSEAWTNPVAKGRLDVSSGVIFGNDDAPKGAVVTIFIAMKLALKNTRSITRNIRTYLRHGGTSANTPMGPWTEPQLPSDPKELLERVLSHFAHYESPAVKTRIVAGPCGHGRSADLGACDGREAGRAVARQAHKTRSSCWPEALHRRGADRRPG
jgi:hypothetical protein